MVVDERARHRLYRKLEEVLGSEEAASLMAHLPPVGWGEVATQRDIEGLRVATKQDLQQLRLEMDLKLDALEHKLTGHLESALRHQTRTFMIFVGSFGFSLAGAVIGAAKLL